MNQSKIHVRYAKALFMLANEKGLLDKLRSDMELLLEVYAENNNFLGLFSNPSFKGSFRKKFFQQVFGDRLNGLTYSFIDLLLENKREIFIPGIARRYLYLYKKEKGILSVTLTSAIPLDRETIDHIQKRIATLQSCEVEMDHLTDPELIGGFILRIEDRLLDASVRGELEKIKEELQNGSVTSKG